MIRSFIFLALAMLTGLLTPTAHGQKTADIEITGLDLSLIHI